MRGSITVVGFRYAPNVRGQRGEMASAWKYWLEEIDLVRNAGGRARRDSDGVLAVYDSGCRRLFEVYDCDARVS